MDGQNQISGLIVGDGNLFYNTQDRALMLLAPHMLTLAVNRVKVESDGADA